MDHTFTTPQSGRAKREPKRHLQLVRQEPALTATLGEASGERRSAAATIGRLIAQTAMLADSARPSRERAAAHRAVDTDVRADASASRARPHRFGWFS